jgi:hypothetical protein
MRIAIIACCLLYGCVDEQNLGFTPVGAPRWAVTLGGLYTDRGLATAIDSIGDVVAVGDMLGPPDSQGLQSISSFVTKRVASDGSERWTVMLSPEAAESYVEVLSVALDSHDSVVVTGEYIGTADFGGQRLSLAEPSPPNRSDMFLAKYSWDGHLEWVRGLSPTANASGVGVAVDSADRILVTGTFSYGSLILGGQHYTESDGDPDTFVAAFDPSGTVIWGAAFQSPNTRGLLTPAGPVPHAIAVDANDDVLVVGEFAAPATFGGDLLDSGAFDRAFLARLRKDGLYLSSCVVGAGGDGESMATQVALASSNVVVVQTVERDDLRNPAYGFVHTFDDNDHERWSSKLADNGDGNPQLRTLAIAPSGLIVSSAWDDAPYNADHPDQVSGSMEVVTYDPGGRTSTSSFGSRMLGGLQATLAVGSAIGSTGTIAYTGEFGGEVNFGTGPVQTHGQNDTDAYIVLVEPPAKP